RDRHLSPDTPAEKVRTSPGQVSRVFGLETEFGIQVDDSTSSLDVVVESMELIRCFLQRDFVARWDYRLENARRDMRGFEVDELLNDTDETVHLQKDRARKIPLSELKSDLIIPNGARLYNDHTHPEYSTPECLSLRDLVASDRAGERILLHCAQKRTEQRSDGTVRLYKNNTDFDGHSYGCHENYLLPRQMPFDDVIQALLPFVVTRQIFAGAGKVGVEADRKADQAVFQLAQRSDFFEVIASVDTMTRRPLVNTRDEPHADPTLYRRLHIIIGDANMCEWATALKVGTMRLILQMLEAGQLPSMPLADPIGAVKSISRDSSRRWECELEDGTPSTALEIQQRYLDHARSLAAGRDEETDWVLTQWQVALEALATDAEQLVGRCDWVTKKWLLDAFAEAEDLDWAKEEDRAWLQSQDLEYHNIDPDEGLFLLLEASGDTVERITDDAHVERSMVQPPADTRAWFRGEALARFSDQIRSLNWDSIEFETADGRVAVIDLKGCVDGDAAAIFNVQLDRANSVEELIASCAAARV
ncbi:MAG: proteasome accessory factor PafA2 family protein, partial [Candidatus Latescibacterota bacterium]|nr:proteasome accessory factor PafA2 family protein [Candidatus Latescibacterota bacterium]